MITLQDIADRARIDRLVDWRQTPRWTRAKLRNQPAVGPDTYEWMTRVSAQERSELVRQALLTKKQWSPLVADQVPKAPLWKEARQSALEGKFVQAKQRQVQHDSRLDHARMFALHQVLAPLVETKLSKAAVAYRVGRSIESTLCEVLAEVRDSANAFRFSATLDITTAYDDVPWDLLDNAVYRHLGQDIEEAALDLVCQSYRAPVVDRRGHSQKRTKGVPQGSVLGPTLLNLYLADLDRVVSRTLANLGARCWRYCDDFLIVAKTQADLLEAMAVVERELQRIRLSVKPETKRVRSLRNPENPAVWLGYCFTLAKTWVPRERTEKKAAELLQQLVAGRLSPEKLDAVLEALRVHHLKILHPDDADRAVRAVRNLIAPFANRSQANKEEEEDTTKNIRNQLRKDSPGSWSTPARSGAHEKHTITLDNPKGNAGGPQSACTPHGGSLRSPETEPNHEVSALDGPDHTLASSDEALELLRTPSSINGASLADPTLHRRTELTRPDQAAHPVGAIGKTSVVTVKCKRVGVARVRATTGAAVRAIRVRIRDVHSIEETLVHGYRVALRELVSGDAALLVRHPTLVGQVRDGHRIRSPALMRAWDLLLAEVKQRQETINFRVVNDQHVRKTFDGRCMGKGWSQ